MAVELLDNFLPKKISLVKNALNIVVKGNKISSYGCTSLSLFGFTNPNINAANSWNLSWNTQSIILLFVATPDNSGNQLPLYNPSIYSSYNDWAIDVVKYLNQNPLLSDDFEISFVPVIVGFDIAIKFEALQNGAAYNLTSNGAPTNITTSFSRAGVDDTVLDNYSIVVEVLVETILGSGEFEVVDTSEVFLDGNNLAKFDIAGILRSQLNYTIPEWNLDKPIVATDLMKRYKLRLSESYGTIPVRQSVNESDEYFALLGGVIWEEQDSNDDLYNGIEQQGNRRRFLTNQPDRKITSENMQEFLWMLFKEDDAVYNSNNAQDALKIELFMQDANGNLVWHPPHFRMRNLVRFNGMCIVGFPVGIHALDLTTQPNWNNCYQYQLWVSDTNGVRISEYRTFVIDKTVRRSEAMIGYVNSFGVIETVRATGDSIFGVADKADVASIYTDLTNNETTLGQSQRWNISIERNYEQNTGWITSKAARMQLVEMLHSEMQLMEMKWQKQLNSSTVQADGDWVRIIVNSDKLALLNSKDFNGSAKFSYVISSKDEVWTNGILNPAKKSWQILYEPTLWANIAGSNLQLIDDSSIGVYNAKFIWRKITKIWKITNATTWEDLSYLLGNIAMNSTNNIPLSDGKWFVEYQCKTPEGVVLIQRQYFEIVSSAFTSNYFIPTVQWNSTAFDNTNKLVVSLEWLDTGFSYTADDYVGLLEGNGVAVSELQDVGSLGTTAVVNLKYRRKRIPIMAWMENIAGIAIPNDLKIYNTAIFGKI